MAILDAADNGAILAIYVGAYAFVLCLIEEGPAPKKLLNGTARLLIVIPFAILMATQIFISTLERQYTGLQSSQLQQFHWLFLAQTRQGWRLVNIYSRTSGFPTANTAISPPIESSKTVVGEAIRIWLNDCYLGKVRE